MILDVKEGKDISKFSLFPESEILLLPNSIFVVEDILSGKLKKIMPNMDMIHLVQQSTKV